MHFGGDYNPEQWAPDVWREDARLMQEIGVNLVSVGIFAWSRIQPAEGEFDWEWLDTVLDVLHAHGVSVNLATATASPPPWAIEAYPAMLPQNERGATYWPGSRQHYAPTSPDYRRLAAELVSALADRYARHPAITLWHVGNEYGCHVRHDYSDSARDAFRRWLQAKYGTVDSLNTAWGTSFWSQRLTSFEQVFPPRLAPTSPNPAGMLDFRRFSSDALLELYVMERDILRAAGAAQPISTNFMGLFPGADYWRWAPELDVIADDNYADPNDSQSFRGAAFARDLMRSLKPDVPWILMEQATASVNWRPTNAPKAAGQMAALSMQAVGHGADGVMFFQWRQSRQGSEKFHSAMVPHAGPETRAWRETVELGRLLRDLPTLPGGRSGARVALVVDWENWWAIDNPDHPVVLDYSKLVQRWYAALHAAHVSIDIVHPIHDLSRYALVVAPQLYLLGDEAAANIGQFVRDGGHLLMSAFSDVVDDTDSFRPGGFQRGLDGILGIQVLEFGALVPPLMPSLRGVAADSAGDAGSEILAAFGPGQSFAYLHGPFGRVRGEYLAEELVIRDAEVIALFTDGRTAGIPALTTSHVGSGRAHYLATIPDDAGMRTIVAWALEEAGVDAELPGLGDLVEVARRGNVLTLINHGTEPQVVVITGIDVASGEAVSEVSLGAFGWAMIRTGT